jgi:hypothetical protein
MYLGFCLIQHQALKDFKNLQATRTVDNFEKLPPDVLTKAYPMVSL